MIDPLIWQDVSFGKLKHKNQILFIACFSNADDYGRLLGEPAYLKSIAFLYKDYTNEDVKEIRDETAKEMKNFKVYSVDGCEYIQFLKWGDVQKQQKDRIQDSKIPLLSKRLASAKQMLPQDKISKDKISKDKIREEKNKDILSIMSKLKEVILIHKPKVLIRDSWYDKWYNDIRLMIKHDGRTIQDIYIKLDILKGHSFWGKQILSADNFRKHYDRLEPDKKKESDYLKREKTIGSEYKFKGKS